MQGGSGGPIAAAAAALLVWGAPGLGARQRGAEQAPTFRSGVEIVTVDVGVVDKDGRPLRGLTAADFIVTVGGQPRHVVTAEFIDRLEDAPAAAKGQGAISSNDGGGAGRLVAFVVDQSTLDLGSARRVARAAGPFLSRLTFVDRSALMLIPIGRNIAFTWAHDRVRAGLELVTGTGRPVTGWEFGSLAEARDIANRNPFALRTIGERECGAASGFGAGAPQATPGAATSPSGTGAPPGGTGGTGTTPAPSGSTGAGSSRSVAPDAFPADACRRNVQAEAETTWRVAQMNSLAGLSVLRQFLEELARVPGDKTVIFISGGWPMDDRDQVSLLSSVAADAAAARASLFTIFVPASPFAADRQRMASASVADVMLYSGPLETLASMTGGRAFRAEIGAEPAFEWLAREFSGYYRLAVEKDPADTDGKSRRLRVQVPRSGASVRARETFDVRTYEDRDWAARLASAIEAPAVATELGLRVTSYVATDPDDRSQLRLLLSGEASRARPGEATLRLVVSDLQGKKVASGEVTLDPAGRDTVAFASNIAVPPGSYIVRVGVMDAAGRVGSVDHRVDVQGVGFGTLSATGPVLVRVPSSGAAESRLALDGVEQGERLAIEIGLEGDQARLERAEVDIEVAATADGPALLRSTAALSRGSREGAMLAQAVANVRVLPPGNYLVRGRVRADGETLGAVRRAFAVIGATRAASDARTPASAGGGMPPARAPARLPLLAAQPFSLDHVLSAPVLDVFLDRVAARSDASPPAVRELLARARADGPGALGVSELQASGDPVTAFLRGLTLLAQNKLELAAAAFREAMRASADFYPAMVYLGACYAAGGRDKEAAGAWRTALIREGDAVALHILLADALLRQDRADLALEDLDGARARWPDDLGVTRRFVTAALLAGRQIDGLQALDALIGRKADDDLSLELALLMLYEAFEIGQPIESVDRDRARMLRLADRYRARAGPSLALVDAWVAAGARKQ